MMIYADDFVRDQDLKRRLYHPEVEEQLRKSEHDIEHQASREQFLKGLSTTAQHVALRIANVPFTDYYKYDFYFYMGGVPSYVPQPGLREFNILSQIEVEGCIEFHPPQARLLTLDDVKAILGSQEFTPGQITLLLPNEFEGAANIIIGLTTKCTKALNDRLAKNCRGNCESQAYEQRRKAIEGTWNLTKSDIEMMGWAEEDTGPISFVPSTNIHRPSYIHVTIIWQIAYILIQKHWRNVRHSLGDPGDLTEQLE